MDDSVKEKKKELRLRYKKLRDGIDAGQRVFRSEIICDNIIKSREYKEADNLLVYIAFRSEVLLDRLISDAYKTGKRVFAPRIEDDRMDFYSFDIDDDLIVSSYGIKEPGKTGLLFDVSDEKIKEQRSLIISPALSVDRDGHRLGYGGGYYDRFISGLKDIDASVICAVYEMQKTDTLPYDGFDIPVDAVCTENGLHYFKIREEEF